MINQLLITGLFAIGFMLIILFNEYIYSKYQIKTEYSRKLAHILACLSSLLFLIAIKSHWYVLFLGLTFFVILYLGKIFDKTKSINSVNRRTIGSYILPISIYLLFFIKEKLGSNLYFILPILILGISDPLAGFVGTFYKSKTKKIKIFNIIFDKTILGSFVFFVSSLIISVTVLFLFDFEITKLLITSFTLALMATTTEIISSKGTDNISVPLITVLIIFIANNCE